MPSHHPAVDLHPVTRHGHAEGSIKAGLRPDEPGPAQLAMNTFARCHASGVR